MMSNKKQKRVAVFVIQCSNIPAAVASHLDSCWTTLVAGGGWYCGSWNSQSLVPLCPRQGGNVGCSSSTGWWQNCLWWLHSTTPIYGNCTTAPLRTGSGTMAYLLDRGPVTVSVTSQFSTWHRKNVKHRLEWWLYVFLHLNTFFMNLQHISLFIFPFQKQRQWQNNICFASKRTGSI